MMLSPSVPVKVTVVGSKVTEMLKRKLQQRLMAEKAKKVKSSLSDDEREPVLPSGSDAKTFSNHTNHPDSKASGASGNSTTTASSPSSFANIDSFINRINFSSQNGQSQHEFLKTPDANKNKIAKPKSSKSKKTQKASTVRCTDADNIANTEASGTNVANCNISTKMEDNRRNCSAVVFDSTNVKPLQSSPNCNTFSTGCYHVYSDMHKQSLTVNGDERGTSLPASGDNCFRNKVVNSCSSEAKLRDRNSELLRPVLLDSSIGGCSGHQNPVIDAEKIPSGIDAKIEMPNEAVNVDEGNVLEKFNSVDIGNKKSLKSERLKSGVIDSSLWPLLYGENSKQLDDYIHRIYCRDCQKSQEEFHLGGEKSDDGGNFQRQNSIGPHSDVKKCHLQHHQDVHDYSPSLHLECKSAREVQQSSEAQTSQKITPLTVQTKDQKTMNVFHNHNCQQLHSATENVCGSNSESTQNSPNATSTPDRFMEKDDVTTMKSLVPGSAGSHSVAVNDNRSTKAKKLSSKSAPKPSNKVIKFHEYKGPPNTSRPTCMNALPPPPAVHSPPLKDDLFQKLQQRQLCLQMQLQLEFQNHQLMANLAGHSSHSCELGSVNRLRLSDMKSPFGIVDTVGKEAVGQPALAKVSFSTMRTPLLLQSASSVMTNPFKFVSHVSEMSHSLTSVSVSLSLPVTSGNHIPTSSLMSTCETPGTTMTVPTWQGDQSWNTRLVQYDMSKCSETPARPLNEHVRTCTSQNNMIIISSTSYASSVQSFCEANTVQSTTVAIANAMTSAPILCVGGKLFPDGAPSVNSNVPKTKNSTGCSPSASNRNTAVIIPSRLEDMKVADLKAECRKRKLVVSGPKPNLIERLRPYEEDILKCLAASMLATAQDGESLNIEKNRSSHVGDQTSSPSSLTSMDSVVNMQPLCPLHEEEEEEKDGGNVSADVDKSVHIVKSSRSSEINFTELDPFKARSHSNFQVPSNLGLSSVIMSATNSKPCFSHGTPVPYNDNTVVKDCCVPTFSNRIDFPTSVSGKMFQENATIREQAHGSKPSVPFALPSFSQLYQLPQQFKTGSIPASNSLLPASPSPHISPALCVATSTDSYTSVASVKVPNYGVNETSPVVIQPSSTHTKSHSVGFDMQLQTPLMSSQMRFPLLTVEQDKTGNIVTSCSSQSLPSGVRNVIITSSPSDPSCLLSVGNHVKVRPCFGLRNAAPPQIVSPSDLLNWQQHQIQELQKQLHLSRLQLLETHRRVLEQQEQFLVNAPISRASCSTSSSSTVQSSLVSDLNRMLERSAVYDHMGVEYGSTLPNIPKLNESTCCDVMQELFEDFSVGISPVAGCVRLPDCDINGNGSEELEAFGDTCSSLLAEEMGDHKTEVDDFGNGFLSPGYDIANHSMLDMCAMEVDVQTGETSVKDDKTDPTPLSEPEKLNNGSFYVSVPLKEPPKYDDAIKDKQKSSSMSSSSVALAANSVDDLLQILMKQTDALGHSTDVADHLLGSENDASPPVFTSPMSQDLAIGELTPQEVDAYPYSAGSNSSSSSGISTAHSTCGDLLNDPLSSAGISSSVFSEIPFQLPDWTDSEFLDLSLLGRLKLDQLDSRLSSNKSQSTASSSSAVHNHASSSTGSTTTLNQMPLSNDYDPCLAGFGPSYATGSLGLTDLLDSSDSNLPSSDTMNFSRSFDILDDLFMMEVDDIFQGPCCSTTDRRLNIDSISTA